jgi:CRISPR/Cas system endoribonuclease Cas6 (RAMP superfamily)
LFSAPWSELAEEAGPARTFRFEFVTPTAFRSGAATIPLPLPTLVFGHFRSRWNVFAPEDLRPHAPLGDMNLLLSHVDIATPGILRFKRATHVGFVGRCTIEARGCPEALRRSLDTLASIAPFSGTGAGTTFGMGVTHYLGE